MLTGTILISVSNFLLIFEIPVPLSISIDNKRWERLEDLPSVAVNRPQFQLRSIPDFLMANERARYVSITPNANACLLHNGKILGWVEQ